MTTKQLKLAAAMRQAKAIRRCKSDAGRTRSIRVWFTKMKDALRCA